MKRDALAVFDFVREHAAGRPVVVHGVSLGSFIAAQRDVDGVVLEATAPDVRSWGTRPIPWYAKPFVRLKIAPALLAESNAAVVRRYAGPLLLLTGRGRPGHAARIRACALRAVGLVEKERRDRAESGPRRLTGVARGAAGLRRVAPRDHGAGRIQFCSWVSISSVIRSACLPSRWVRV